MRSKNQIIIICQSVIIVILIIILLKLNNINNLRKDYLEFNSKSVSELSKEQYERVNNYLVYEAKKLNKKPDTISYKKAKKQEAEFKAINEEISRQENLKQYNCDEYTLINSFHEMMSFNNPYEKYDKTSINANNFNDCSIQISVTTKEPKYGWKTFWIFEVYFDASDSKFHMKTIKKDFLG